MNSVNAAGGLLLETKDISKQFPGVCALDKVDFQVYSGEVHALLGENGAGKSTLMHILAGVFPPDEGTLRLLGREVRFADARAAQAAGVSMVFQERSLASTLSVAENVFFARQPTRHFGIIDREALHTRTRVLLEELGMAMSPEAPLEELSPAEQQMVEIAKALSLEARLLILDEPTSALTSEETGHLFQVMDRLRQRGVGIIYISHRLAEVFRIADRVTVLKDGRWQGTLPIGEVTSDRLISLMVGREFEIPTGQRRAGELQGVPALKVSGLRDRTLLRDISFEARAGEIVALAGLSGAGRSELALTLFGARPRSAGQIFLEGQPVDCRSPHEAIGYGIGYLPEDRKESGLFLEMSIAANIASGRLAEFGSFWMDKTKMAEAAAVYSRRLRIASPDVHKEVGVLSGGNQQKVVLAKWLLVKPRVLIADEPTRGVDVGAKAEIHAILRELAESGTAVILISSELPEVLAVADRIYVMREGSITGELQHHQASEEAILRFASLPGGKHGRGH